MFGPTMSLSIPPSYGNRPPGLYRSRSHTDPRHEEASPDQTESSVPKPQSSRPPNIRSRSYLSATDPKHQSVGTAAPTGTLQKPAEKHPRLHLPGSSLRHHNHSHSHSHLHHHHVTVASHKRHRPTQSEAYPGSRGSKEGLTTLPHLVAGLNAEREKRTQAGGINPINPLSRSAGTTSHAPFGPSPAQAQDYNEGGRYDLRRRATSDPNYPPLRPKTSFEKALERGDQARWARRAHVRVEDIQRRDGELAAAEDEMRSRIGEITSTGVEITRRLDYGYYNLLEKLGNLVAMITSFQSLATQSGHLIANFDKETKRLDADTKRRASGFAEGFEARKRKAAALAERGQKASEKAKDLSARLDRARLTVEEWEKREDKFRRAWDRVFGIVLWTSVAVLVLVVLTVLGKEWYFHGDPVKAGLRAHSEGSWNHSLRLGGDEGTPAGENQRKLLLPAQGEGEDGQQHPEGGTFNLPDDVREILLGIAERNRQRKVVFPAVPREMVDGCAEAENCLDANPALWEKSSNSAGGDNSDSDAKEDPRLRVLDEL